MALRNPADGSIIGPSSIVQKSGREYPPGGVIGTVSSLFRRFKYRLWALVPLALWYPHYRGYWLGTVCAAAGIQVLWIALNWLIYDLTGSALYLGYMGLAAAVPSIVLTPIGGVVADKADKRTVILATESIYAVLILGTATLTLLDIIQPWHLLILGGLTGAVNALENPAHFAIYPKLIGRESMTSAVALDSGSHHAVVIVGSLAAGALIVSLGTASAFYVAGSGHALMVFALWRLKAEGLKERTEGHPWQTFVNGLLFIRGTPLVLWLIVLAFMVSFFGMGYTTLMPVFAVDVLEVGAGGVGVMFSAAGGGALLATIWLSTKGGLAPTGRFILGGAAGAGLAIGAFALTAEHVRSYELAIILLVVHGASFAIFEIALTSTLQLLIPDHMRGRVMGIFGLNWDVMPLGGMQAGAIASVIGAPLAVAIGGFTAAGISIGPGQLLRRLRGGVSLDY